MPLEQAGRTAALELLFNASNTFYVALFSTPPTDGSGEVEISPVGYVRVAHNSWVTEQDGGVTKRCSSSPVVFGPYAEEVTIKGWGIYDAPVGGNLVASGIFFDAGGSQAGAVTVPASEDIQFQPGEFCMVLGSDCPIVIGDGDGDGDICSLIDNIQVSIGGAPPVAWTIGDPPLNALSSQAIDVFITLVAPSTDMPGFTVSVTAASGDTITPAGPSAFLVQYNTGLAGSQIVTVENTNNTPTCTYALGAVTIVA